MNTRELQDRLSIRSIGSGQYRVTLTYRNKTYTTTSNNTLAYDRLHCSDDVPDRAEVNCYTYKQALESFYYKVRRDNDLI